jgi:hypothetical protein
VATEEAQMKLVRFEDIIDLEEKTLQPLENPFGPKV